MDWERVQQEWDAQQSVYMPDREERFAAMLDTIEAVVGDAPRILDLAGGTGSITRRVLARFPAASSVLVDVDAALLAIAGGTFADDPRVRVVAADLATPQWLAELGESDGSFDAVVTATALHWLSPERVAAIYAESARLLRAGGIFANADHMVDDALPSVTAALEGFTAIRKTRLMESSGATDWDGWWAKLRTEPELAAQIAARDERFADRGASHTESEMPSTWHTMVLRDAGYAEAGLVWRGLTDAVVVAVR